MNADRELLELAAKAAGMYVLPEDAGTAWPNEDGWFYCLHHGEPAMHFRKYGKHPATYFVDPWKPVTDDGDALRLAVYLDFGIEVMQNLAVVRAGNGEQDAVEVHWNLKDVPDALTATRRAIVLAAAEIGKAMS